MWVKFGQNTEAAPAWTGVITLVPRSSSRGSSPVLGIGFTNPETLRDVFFSDMLNDWTRSQQTQKGAKSQGLNFLFLECSCV